MVQQVNVGSFANAGDGDVLRAAFIKINAGLLEAEASAGIATGARDQAVAAGNSAAGDANAAAASETNAETAYQNALLAVAAAGPVRIFKDKAEAVAQIAAVAADAYIEVEADESLAGSPRTRYQKVSGAYVFRLNMDRFNSLMLTAPQSYKVGPFIDKLKTKPCRVLLLGTSIASFQVSAIRIVAELLANTYGRSAGVIWNLGAFGGNYLPQGGHKKQPFGGASYYRMVLSSGEADLVFTEVVDKIILVYGKESTGGAFDVYIDGVLETSLTSNGAQQYNVEYVKTFAARGQHTIAIKAPASGKAYLERVEMLTDDAGVYIENATLGGTGLYNAATIFSGSDPSNEAGIAISGYNGIDAMFGRTGQTKPDIILCQHFTNDGNLSVFQDLLGRAVAKTKAGGTPLVLLTEMPALSFVNNDGTLVSTTVGGRREIRDTILSYINEKHVAVVDWTEMVDYSNKTAYEAKYFPGVDKTHPADDGHAVLTAALSVFFDVPYPGRKVSEDLTRDRLRANMVLPQIGATDDPYGFRFVRPSGSKVQAQDAIHSPVTQTIGQAITPNHRTVSVQLSDKVPNLVQKSFIDAILASSTSDKFGKYLAINSNAALAAFQVFSGTTLDQVFTVVLQLKYSGSGGPNVRVNTPFNNKVPRIYAGDDRYTTTDAIGFSALDLLTDAPQFYSFQLKANDTDAVGNVLQISGSNIHLYNVWITEGKQAVVTSRLLDVYRGLGLPMFMSGDESIDRVTVGQTYLESVNSATVEKLAIEGFCCKPLAGTFHRLYEMRNKGALGFFRLLPISPGTLTYSDKIGGQAAASSGASGWGNTQIFAGPVPYSKTFTALVRAPNNGSIRIYFFNGGNNNYTWLKSDGSWDSGAVSENSIPSLTAAPGGMAALQHLAYTFAMPDSSFATALGGNPAFKISVFGGSSAWTPATLVEGSSACVSATA